MTASPRILRIIKKTLRWCGYGMLCGVVVLLLFEVIYRYQLVDTYRPELRAYNTAAALENAGGKPTVLIMGDSFTAGTHSYAEKLRPLMPDYRIINAGVSGTGIAQATIMAPRRFEAFKPSIFIYQIYVGNDLINVRYPVNWEAASVVRNVYRLVSGRLRSVYFMNYRLGQRWYAWTRPAEPPPASVDEVFNAPFSVEAYSPIQKRYLRADPWILENQILAQADRAADFETLLKGLEDLRAHCDPATCTAYLLVIPHASQVHPRYLAHMQALGAQFRQPAAVQADVYPFLTGIQRAFAETPSVHVLDPLPPLKGHEQAGRAMYFNNDGHLNLEGQAVVADFVKAQLQQE